MSTDQKRLIAAGNIINNDEVAGAIGKTLAEVLKLKHDVDHKDRWATSYGSKTNIGLGKTVFGILEDNNFDINQGEVGAKIADVLRVKHDHEYRDRYQTTWGSKTHLGLAAITARIIYEAAEAHTALSNDTPDTPDDESIAPR